MNDLERVQWQHRISRLLIDDKITFDGICVERTDQRAYCVTVPGRNPVIVSGGGGRARLERLHEKIINVIDDGLTGKSQNASAATPPPHHRVTIIVQAVALRYSANTASG